MSDPKEVETESSNPPVSEEERKEDDSIDEPTGEDQNQAKKEKKSKKPHKLLPSKIELGFRNEIRQYYEKHFDIEFLLKLLKNHPFETREFGFIRRDDNRMYRNQSFEDPKYLVEYLSTFPVNHGYIGAIYEDRVMPSINYTPGISIDQTKWLGRELTFDLDLTDYDPVRTCGCQGREFCSTCWKLMQEAAEVIESTLRYEFGFEEIVWIFSGGRGYHCWVLDDIAFVLNEEQRKAIVGYFQLIYTTVNYEKIEEVDKLSIDLRDRIYQKLVRPYILNSESKELQQIDGFGKKRVENAKQILKHTEIPIKILGAIPSQSRDALLEKVIREHYPRLDGAVTEGHNHLIRLPGTVHMGTGYITQVVDNPRTFDPLEDAIHVYDYLELDRSELHLDEEFQSTIFKIDDPNYSRWKIVDTFKKFVNTGLFSTKFIRIDLEKSQLNELYDILREKMSTTDISDLIDTYKHQLSSTSLGSDASTETKDDIIEDLRRTIISNLIENFQYQVYNLGIKIFVGLARIEHFAKYLVSNILHDIQTFNRIKVHTDANEGSTEDLIEDLTIINGIGPKMAEELFKKGIKYLSDIINLNIDELSSYDGVGKKTAENILSEVHDMLKKEIEEL